MSAEEIVRGLRTSTPKCYPINCDRCTGVIDSLDCDYFVAQKAADLIESQAAEVKDLNEQMEACCQQIGLMTSDYENQIRILKAQFSASQQETRAARNELCLKCGRYHEAHKGACDGCRWKVVEHE